MPLAKELAVDSIALSEINEDVYCFLVSYRSGTLPDLLNDEEYA